MRQRKGGYAKGRRLVTRRRAQAIAQARGDLDQFLALEARRPDWRQDPFRSAERLLAAGRLDEALSWVRREHRGGLAYV
ncbi:DUF6880 family protein [Rhodoblastus sphagnicola]|uniref:DUF6880 family protein n=1 Tax=Rhodoblastus sphagnicola TaxID=333368 RepID=UPI003CC8A313